MDAAAGAGAAGGAEGAAGAVGAAGGAGGAGGAGAAGGVGAAVTVVVVGALLCPLLEPPHAATPIASPVAARIAVVRAACLLLHALLITVLLLFRLDREAKHIGVSMAVTLSRSSPGRIGGFTSEHHSR